MKYKIKKTVFHRDWRGRNRLVSNTTLDSCNDSLVAQLQFMNFYREYLCYPILSEHEWGTCFLIGTDVVNLRLVWQ